MLDLDKENLCTQFDAMLKLQNKMNTKVHPQWLEQNYAYYRALWLECGELIEHYGYKWWKKQVPDMEQVTLEIVDIWHFGLSMLLDGSPTRLLAEALVSELMASELIASELDAKLGVLEATEALACDVLSQRQFSVAKFWALLVSADLTADDLYRSYVGKNVLNFFRQDHGYKDGSYIKEWAGREDNEHLVEISAGLDAASASFETTLYEQLESRYQELQPA